MNCSICDRFIGRDIMKEFLDNIEFDDWEEKFGKQSIEYNPIVLFCPRCNNYAVREEENLGICKSCTFQFCQLCNHAWHPGNCSNFLEHETFYKNQKEHIPEQELTRQKEIKQESILSELMMNAFMKRCPKCKCCVMREFGCNHMICTLCSTEFCYACGNSSCEHGILCDTRVPTAPVDIENLDDEQKQFLEKFTDFVKPAAAVQNEITGNFPDEQTKCAFCKSNIERLGLNNHAKCVVCKTQFCFLCKTIIKGTCHFSPQGCPQHGRTIKK